MLSVWLCTKVITLSSIGVFLTNSKNDGHLRFTVAELEEEGRDEGEGHRGGDLQTCDHGVHQDKVKFADPGKKIVFVDCC